MTAKIDGTNGLIQQYDYQVLTTAFTYTFAAGTTVLVINPAGTLATGTITFPAAPADGMTVTFSSTQQITALTLAGNGKTIVSSITAINANQAVTYVYRLSNTSWYPITIVASGGSIITSGTSVASTSGTSIDFTSIPSWVKRVTVMFQGVSTNGTSVIQIQIGAGSVTTTGYLGAGGYFQNANVTGSATLTSGFAITAAVAANCVYHGSMVITLLGSNAWVANGAFARSDIATNNFGQGSISLGGTLDRVRITTVNGTDTFDAGSINILYE